MICARLDINWLPPPRNGLRQVARLDALEKTLFRPLRRILIDRDLGRHGRAQYIQHDGANGDLSKRGHVHLLGMKTSTILHPKQFKYAICSFFASFFRPSATFSEGNVAEQPFLIK
jgi:hypothetical protein